MAIIGGIDRLKGLFGTGLKADVRRNNGSAADRDADGRRKDDSRQRIKRLSEEQEAQAVAKLNQLASFSKAGLSASLVKGEGLATHVVVKNSSGAIVRRLTYEELIDLYLDRYSDVESGRLYKRAA